MTFMMAASQQITTGGTDVTPNAVNWVDIYDGPSPIYTNTQQITGINTIITLEIQIIDSWDMSYLNVGVNTSNSYGGTITDITNGGTFTVNNNEYVTFEMAGNIFGNVTFSVTNNSDANAVLDTIYMQIQLV
jgi:hypothetical protein